MPVFPSCCRPPCSLLLLTALLVSPAFARAQPAGTQVMPLKQVHAGLKGEVWTVFQGDRPEPFDVQVSGIVKNALGPGKDLILCELTDPRVQNMGAVAGMSGSPLYIDGRIVGVLSYQIQRFETVRYAGFTPIGDMLEVSNMPDASAPGGNTLPGTPADRRKADHRNSGKVDATGLSELSPVFSASGLSPELASLLDAQLHPLGLSFTALGGNAGGASSETDVLPKLAALHPGDVVAAALSMGDITLAATGTVSHVDGRHVLAFGHPMMSLGATELPMASAEVVTILPSTLNSVKISNTGHMIGTFSQDRLSGIYGELGRRPHMVPVEVDLPARLNRKSLHFTVVRQETLLPAIAAVGIAQAVLGSNEAGLTHGFRVTTKVDFPGEAPVGFSQIYPGPQGFNQGLGEFIANLQQWVFNPFEHTFPERIRFSVEETAEVPLGYVENLQISRAEIAPGGTLTVALHWHGFQADASTETVSLSIPAEWAGKELEIVLASGPGLDELTGQPKVVPIAQLRNFSDYLAALRNRRATDGLYLAVVERARIFSDQRNQTADLPGSLERIARASDETRFQKRDAVVPIWETHLLPGLGFTTQIRRPLQITD